MALGKKTGGRNFEPGNKLGTGRPALPNDLRILMKTTGENMKRDMCAVVYMSVGEIQAIDGNPPKNMSVFKAALISSLNNTLQTGDDRSLRLIMDRILGKIPEAIIEPDDQTQDTSKDATISRLVEIMNDGIKKE